MQKRGLYFLCILLLFTMLTGCGFQISAGFPKTETTTEVEEKSDMTTEPTPLAENSQEHQD